MPNDKRSNISLKRKRSWVWAGVLLSLSTWMFFLGVLVGRGTAPIKFDIDKLEQTLLMKRKAADQKEMETISGNLDSGPDKTKLDFLCISLVISIDSSNFISFIICVCINCILLLKRFKYFECIL